MVARINGCGAHGAGVVGARLGSAVLLAAVVGLSGCSYIPLKIYEPGPDKTGKAIAAYCSYLGEERRQALREQVNAHAHPHTVRITCASDE